jgi:beta-glucanase (GH16 family)
MRRPSGSRKTALTLIRGGAALVVSSSLLGITWTTSGELSIAAATLPIQPEIGHGTEISAATRPSPRGPLGALGSWTLKFSDGFSGASLNRSKWKAGRGTNSGNHELEWYLPSQISVYGNALHLTAMRLLTPGHSKEGWPLLFTWASGLINTRHSFHFKYGFVQIVARVPKGDGFWPALWLLPSNGSWPPEIDIMEVWGHNTGSPAFTAISGSRENRQRRQSRLTTADLSSSFHTYAIDWEPGSIVWYLDGRKVYRVTSGVSKEPMYLIANLAIDGLSGLRPDASTPLLGSLDIKRVDVWQH